MIERSTDVNALYARAEMYPGHYWMLLNEPDFVYGTMPPQEAAEKYDLYYSVIKAADPTATIGGINLTAIDSEGKANGVPYGNPYETYLADFLAYVSSPIEFYCIHDWFARQPFVDGIPTWGYLEKHIAYIRTFPQLATAPIWLTETGGTGDPYSDAASVNVRDTYMIPLLAWLESTGFDLGIERVAWFSVISGNYPYGEPPWRDDSLFKNLDLELSPLGEYWKGVGR